MSATTVFNENHMVIQLGDTFNFHCQAEFRQAYENNLNNETESIVVDFHRTRNIDSSSLGMLLVLKDFVEKTCNSITDSIQLKNCAEEVEVVFEIANFDRLFLINQSL
jgi:anti-anti-sigma factor